MKIGYLGLGKMGKNMVLKMLEKDHQVVAWNRSKEPRDEVAAKGAKSVDTIKEVVLNLESPRTIWLMLPAGTVTEETIDELLPLLDKGDTIIDGANSNFNSTKKVAKKILKQGINFLDVGVSGGPDGARNGACLMIGGNHQDFKRYLKLFKDIAAPGAVQFFPGHGAGHFVKMVHNGIEYGMMQAIGEGFEVLQKSEYQLDLEQVADIYNHRSVIESRLVGWLQTGYQKHGQKLDNISGTVAHSGEGQWTVETAKTLQVPVPVIKSSLKFRIDSTKTPSYTGKVVSLLRQEFGGHVVSEVKNKK